MKILDYQKRLTGKQIKEVEQKYSERCKTKKRKIHIYKLLKDISIHFWTIRKALPNAIEQ
jgi:hypothetical protein